MVALEVSRNGKRLCVAGSVPYGMVDASVYWYSRPDGQSYSRVRVDALHTDTQVFATWVNRAMRVGDEVTIRVIEATEGDRPKRRRQPTKSSTTLTQSRKRTGTKKGR